MRPVSTIVTIYIIISVPIFFLVYQSSQNVIDEEFHLKQAEHYCHGDFHIWDPKITTLPGLYIVSAIFLLPFQWCTVAAFRLTSFVSSVLNVILIHEIRRIILQKHKVNSIKLALESFNLAIFPPLYLFAHLYYTDVLSLTTVLAMILFNLKQRHGIAALFGFFSILMRQTNIIWIGMAVGCTFLEKLISQTLPFVKDKEKRCATNYSFDDIYHVLQFYCKRIYVVPKQIRLLSMYLSGYIAVIIIFIAFILINGSIVVGDKSAHQAAIHLPQLFYFGLFTAVLAPSISINYIGQTLKTFRYRWYWTLMLSALFALIVWKNTIVHPYLLADNRHYMFYVWNKFYGRYTFAPYIIIPAYLYAFVTMGHAIESKSAGFKLMFIICLIASIALQQLIELRYFLIPFMIFRLNISIVKTRWLLFELIFYILINAIVFYQFATKEIYWSEYDHVQRLIW